MPVQYDCALGGGGDIGGGGAPFGSSIADASMAGMPGDPTQGYIPGGCMACLPNQDPYNSYVGTTPIAIMNPKSMRDTLNPNTDPEAFVEYANAAAQMGVDAWGNLPSDPCVYLNASGTGFDNQPGPGGQINPIDTNSSPQECQATGGKWVPDGLVPLRVDANGNIVSMLSAQSCNQMNRGIFWLGTGTTVYGMLVGGFWGGGTAALLMGGSAYYLNNKLCGGPGFFTSSPPQ